MGCMDSLMAATTNGFIIGMVVGITLGVIKSFQGELRSMSDLIKELVPECVVIGAVIGFSHALLSSCYHILQTE